MNGCGHVQMSDDPVQVAEVLLSGSASGAPAAVVAAAPSNGGH